MVMQLMPEGAAALTSRRLRRPPEDVQQLMRGEADLIFTDLEQPALKDNRLLGYNLLLIVRQRMIVRWLLMHLRKQPVFYKTTENGFV